MTAVGYGDVVPQTPMASFSPR
ncbi:MAG: hypothetical protein MK538_04920 [Planctomycetes bacterium]|nr:hypothetical protein [Planctomycetota bacterium]